MSVQRPLSVDQALHLAAAFAASCAHPICDKTLSSGEIVPKCFSGKQLADFLRSEEAGEMQARAAFARRYCVLQLHSCGVKHYALPPSSARMAQSFYFDVFCQVSSDDQLLHAANELIRRDVVHEINDAVGFCMATLSADGANLFRLIDDEDASYLKKRATLASFISPRHSPSLSSQGFSFVLDHQAKYFTGSVRTWRPVHAVLSVLGAQPAHRESVGQIHFAVLLLFENEFGLPNVDTTVTGGQDKVLKIVSLRCAHPTPSKTNLLPHKPTVSLC